MTRRGTYVAIGAAHFLAVAAYPQIQLTIADGGSVIEVIEREYSEDTIINEGSSLRRSWVTLNDTACPLEIVDVSFRIERGKWLGATGHMRPRVPISAFEIRNSAL